MNQFDVPITVPTSQSISLDDASFIKSLSIQEQSMLSGGEIKTCKNGLKPFNNDFSTCPENRNK